METCVEACRDLGGWAQLVGLLALGARWAWAEIARRRTAKTARDLELERESLAQQVLALSLRPPKVPADVPSLGAVMLEIRASEPRKNDAPAPAVVTDSDSSPHSAAETETDRSRPDHVPDDA